MINIQGRRIGPIWVAANTNDLWIIEVAIGLTQGSAERRLMRRLERKYA